MKNRDAKILVLGALALSGFFFQASAQEGYQQQPTAAYQQYQYQQPNRTALRRSYDPDAGMEQTHRSLREQINPCNRNYGIVMDGWQDVVLLTTVKSVEWWITVILLIALAAVGFDDFYRKQRAKDQHEATAGMAQILLNDRSFCLKRANEAIYLHNKLILQGNSLVLEADARNQAESHMAIRSMSIQAAEWGPVVEAESLSVPATGNLLALEEKISEPEDAIREERETAAGGLDDAELSKDGDKEVAENVRQSTLEHGGKKYKVPTPVRLLVQAQQRKIENQRVKINQLEERLRQYEKD